MIGRRELFLGLISSAVMPTRLFAQTFEDFRPFVLPIFGAQGEIPSRLVSYETILQANYDRSHFVLRDMGKFGEKIVNRARWAEEAKRKRGFDIDISSSLNGIVYLVLRDSGPSIIFDEGFMNAAISFAFTIANLQTIGADPEEFQYWIANFYDAIKWSDPIPYFRGFDYFHRFFEARDFEYFGEAFFEVFGKTLTSITTFPMFHEIGHFVLRHTPVRPNSNSEQKVWSKAQEAEADVYAIEVCGEGLRLSIGPALIFFNLLNYMRREYLASHGLSVPDTHAPPEKRFESNMVSASKVDDDKIALETANYIFSLAVDTIKQAGPDRADFDELRYGDFQVTSGLPQSYRRFFRRSCNLENYRYSTIGIGDGTVETALNFLPDPLSLEPVGSCFKTFVP